MKKMNPNVQMAKSEVMMISIRFEFFSTFWNEMEIRMSSSFE